MEITLRTSRSKSKSRAKQQVCRMLIPKPALEVTPSAPFGLRAGPTEGRAHSAGLFLARVWRGGSNGLGVFLHGRQSLAVATAWIPAVWGVREELGRLRECHAVLPSLKVSTLSASSPRSCCITPKFSTVPLGVQFFCSHSKCSSWSHGR